jgi:hypothetical protein
MGWIFRDNIETFVVNERTMFDVPVIHTPACHHVKEHVADMQVIDRFPVAGFDLLEALRSAGKQYWNPCQHCIVRKSSSKAAA